MSNEDDIYTNGIYDLKTLQEIWRNKEKNIKFVYFCIVLKDDELLEQYNSSCLSQWFHTDFKDKDGNQYTSCEQYMMAQKAILFGDNATLQQILGTNDTNEINNLGRQVTPFNQKVWDEKCQDIVFNGNLYKFSQDKKCNEYIMSVPYDTIFVEANPKDEIWGIHLPASNPDAKNPLKWKGKNLLGFQLTKVRDHLLKLEKEQEE